MRGADLPRDVIDKLAGHASLAFGTHEQWMEHLRALGIADLRATPDPVRATSEAAPWGAIEAEGLLGHAVIVSDDAGQFRLGDHALCWVHAERLVYKLVPANDKQSNAVKVARRMIWWFYRRLKEYKRAPSPQQASLLGHSMQAKGVELIEGGMFEQVVSPNCSSAGHGCWRAGSAFRPRRAGAQDAGQGCCRGWI